MPATSTPALGHELELRFEAAVLDGLAQAASVEAWRVPVDRQERHRDRMSCCQVSLLGDGWLGILALLVPERGGEVLTAACREAPPLETFEAGEIAEGLGCIAAAIALRFADAFAGEERLVVSGPSVLTGDDLALSFPWGRHFESRQCFQSRETVLWAILRLSRRR